MENTRTLKKRKGYKMKFFEIVKKVTEKRPSKKILSIIVSILVVVILTCSVGVYIVKADSKVEEEQKLEITQRKDGDESSFTAEGSTSMGTISQMPDFSLNVVLMYVEEVYVEAGSTVEEGDPLFKIADECIENAKAYYEKAITAAQDNLTEAQVAYESGKIDAEYIKLDSETAAANAAAIMEADLAEIDENIQEKYEAAVVAVNELATYNNYISNNVYYTNYGIGEKTAAAAEAKTVYENACATYNTTYDKAKKAYNEAVAQLVEAVNNSSDTTSIAQQVAYYYTVFNTLDPLYEAYQSTQQELSQATTLYEKDVKEAKNKIEQLSESVFTLNTIYDSAYREVELKKLEIQNEYNLTILEGKYADSTYNNTIETLKEAVESAEEKLADLKEAQANLLALEDGIVTASQAGTIASVRYDVDDVLFSNIAFVTYYDTSTLTISLEIDQENIAKVTVGDEVNVSVSGNRRGNITGTITSIATSATTGQSVSDVTYAVVVSVDNQDNSLSAGVSAEVIFEDVE